MSSASSVGKKCFNKTDIYVERFRDYLSSSVKVSLQLVEYDDNMREWGRGEGTSALPDLPIYFLHGLKGHRVGVGVNATMSVELGAVDICG